MESGRSGDSTVLNMPESKVKTNGKGKTPATSTATTKATPDPRGGSKKGIAILDFILRLFAIAAAIGATATMGAADQQLPFFTQFFQFEAQYDDFEVFVFFLITNGIVSAYLILSLPFSIVCIIRPYAAGLKLLLIIFDTVIMALTIAAAAAAASIVYLAHSGNPNANWLAICQQFGDFCQATSAAVVASFITSTLLICLIVLSAFALRRN
ncbi:CASP-like protein [Melia azedarach]|uniref:CASP-like protein n=1 Tax=Melia azedarach TaxID=155640 RepID=A0ACC1YQP8_MELAZ|nr:CASP-like protein [Melia azedarach]